MKELGYTLLTIDEPEIQNVPEYKFFRATLKKFGCITINEVNIYSPELALIFTSKELPAINRDTGERTALNGFPFLETFIEGYNEGGEYFDKKFSSLPYLVYGENSEAYVRDIHENFYHAVHFKYRKRVEGWGKIKYSFPVIFNHELIKGYGFFSGIVSTVEELASQHPHKFKDWQRCGQAAVPQQTVQPKPDLNIELAEIKNMENLFWKGLPMEAVVKHFEVMTILKNKNGNVFLKSEQLVSFLKRGFLNDITQPKQKINCSTSEKGFVIKRFYELYVLAASQYGHPNRKAKFIKLFNDCFDNWEESTVDYFFKNKTKETW